MIRINLIPKKVSKKKMGLVQNLAITGGVYLIVFGVLGYLTVTMNGKISNLRVQLNQANAEKERLKNVQQEKQKYEQNIAKLKSQLDIIAQIKNNRLLPVRVLDDLTRVIAQRKAPVLDGRVFSRMSACIAVTGSHRASCKRSLKPPSLARRAANLTFC